MVSTFTPEELKALKMVDRCIDRNFRKSDALENKEIDEWLDDLVKKDREADGVEVTKKRYTDMTVEEKRQYKAVAQIRYNTRNKKKGAETNKRYRQNHRDIVAAQQKAYREENKERLKELYKIWYEENGRSA